MKTAIKWVIVALVFIMAKPMLAAAQSGNSGATSNSVQAEIQKNTKASEDDDNPFIIKDGDKQVHVDFKRMKGPEDIVVPIAFFVFLLTLFLGRRYLIEKTQQRKIELLEKMVEKGQPVSDSIVQQVFYDDRSRHSSKNSPAKTVRRGVAFTAIGAGLLVYSLLLHQTGGKLIVGIVFLGLGISYLVSRRFEKNDTGSSDI